MKLPEEISVSVKDVPEVIKQFEKANKEIERLNKELQDTKEHLGEYLYEQEEENKRLNNIIQEVREYIKKLNNFKIKYVMFGEKELYASENDFIKELLEILDKES